MSPLVAVYKLILITNKSSDDKWPTPRPPARFDIAFHGREGGGYIRTKRANVTGNIDSSPKSHCFIFHAE